MKTVFISNDGTEVFESKADCLAYDREQKKTAKVPLIFLREAIRQCTPYMIPKRERDWLREKLEQCLPPKERPKREKSRTRG